MANQNDLKTKIAGILGFFMASKKIFFAVLVLAALAYCGLVFFLYALRDQPLNPNMKNISLDERVYEMVNAVVSQRQANMGAEKNYPDPFN
jgi:hypothetical protein